MRIVAGSDLSQSIRLADQIAELAFGLFLREQRMAEKTAEARDIALGGRVGCQHLQTLALPQITHRVMQQHHRLRAEQPPGIQLGIG